MDKRSMKDAALGYGDLGFLVVPEGRLKNGQ